MRRALVRCGFLLLAPACGGGDDLPPPADAAPPQPVADPIPYVDPFVGSGGFGFHHGSCFPGAAAPQGLAKVGPDTSGPFGTVNFLHYSGYWWGDDVIRGFSHLHLHGTGGTDYGVLGLMPQVGPGDGATTMAAYASPFAKASEAAAPGSYAVTLGKGDIRVEIAATPRAAHHRFSYPAGTAGAHLVFDLDHHLEDGSVADAEVTLAPAERRASGRLRSLGGMSSGFGGYDVFFAVRTRGAWTGQTVWTEAAPPAPGVTAAGRGVGFALDLDLAASPVVEVQVGLSLTSEAAAAANLDAELPAWDFDGTRAATAAAWRALLGTVKVSGGSEAERRILYTALYHAFLMPTVVSDVDGRYRAPGGAVQTAAGFRYVTDLSLWDTYRTLHPLYALIAPDRALDAVRSLHEMAKAMGYFPKWPIATGESGSMLGASAEIVVADAYLKGLTDFDAAGAYAILRAAAMDPVAPAGGRGGRGDVESYMMLGYVPASADRSVSMTTEYANDDFALGQLAAALGHAADAEALAARATGYRALFDPATGFLRGRWADGTFSDPRFDPTFFGPDFAEANAWQSLWMPAFDADGLASLMGGRAAMVAKLEELFTLSAQDAIDNPPGDITTSSSPRPYYWHANEPDLDAVYLFAQLGRPDLTARWLRWIQATHYAAAPDGLAGNDDGGTLSAWYVWGALGLYPLPGSDRYVIGAPLFPRAEVAVEGGTFTIEAPAVSAENLYVQAVTLDGAPVAGPELRHGELRAGRTLRFEMGPAPGSWGR